MREEMGVSAAALARIDRAEKHFRLALLGGVLLESAFLVGFVLLANLKDRTHLLILLSTVASYTILILGLCALGAHATRCTQRILSALDATAR